MKTEEEILNLRNMFLNQAFCISKEQMLTEEGRRNYIALKAQAGALDIVLGFINYDVNESTCKEWEIRANTIRGKYN